MFEAIKSNKNIFLTVIVMMGDKCTNDSTKIQTNY